MTPDRRPPRRVPLGLIAFCVFTVGSSAAFAWYQVHLRGQRSDWRFTTGVVSQPKLTLTQSGHKRLFSVSYEVDGRTYHTARQQALAGMDLPIRGDTVLVYYDPEDPRASELRTDEQDRASMLSPVVWIVICGFVILMWRRRRRRDAD